MESSQNSDLIPVKITALQDYGTKTTLDGALVKWSETDSIGLFTSGTKLWNQNNKFIADEINGTTATFTSNVQAEDDIVDLYFYYPFEKGNTGKLVNFDYSNQVFSKSEDYGKYALLTGKVESVGDMNNIPGITFKNSNTLFATNIKNQSADKYLIVKGVEISIVGGESLFPVKGTYNLVSELVTVTETSNAIRVKVGGENGLSISPGSTQTIPLFTMPVDLTGKQWNITITLSDQVKTIPNNGGKNYGLKKYNISYELIGTEVSGGTTENATASTSEQLIEAGTNAKNIVLSENIQLNEMLSLSLAEDQVIDLNGKTLSMNAENLKGLLSIDKTSENKVTIKNGTIDATLSTGQGDAVRIEEGSKVTDVILEGVTIKAKGNGINNRARVAINLNMTDCKIESNWFGIYQNGNVGGSTYTVTNCIVTNNGGPAIFMSGTYGNGSALNISGGSYSGVTGVEVKHADVSIQNATLIATATPASYVATSNGSCTAGYAFATTKNITESGASGNVTISGCTLTLPTTATNDPIYNDGGAVVTQL
jgi:hypothetical protein